jgi:hypothetical protein
MSPRELRQAAMEQFFTTAPRLGRLLAARPRRHSRTRGFRFICPATSVEDPSISPNLNIDLYGAAKLSFIGTYGPDRRLMIIAPSVRNPTALTCFLCLRRCDYRSSLNPACLYVYV